jgi:hypothetical protein
MFPEFLSVCGVEAENGVLVLAVADRKEAAVADRDG